MKPLAIIQMHLEGIMLSEITQIEKDKYYMISLIIESKTKEKQKQTERTN